MSRNGGGGQDSHKHEKIPIEAATRKRVYVDREDLGHPKDPGMRDRLYQQCAIGTLICGNCTDDSPLRYLYLTRRYGQLRVSAYSLDRLRAAGLIESDEHHALKDAICRLAEREGLDAEQEQGDAARRRRTDVVVQGGHAEVGWEVQLSAIDQPQLRRRIGRANSDGLVSSWLTMNKSHGFTSIIDRAPACSLKELTAREIATSDDLRVFQGVKQLQVVRCTDQRTQRWHRELDCNGHHVQPKPLNPTGHPSLAQMITASAAGDVVTIRWPRKLALGYNRPWLWVPRADADVFYEVENPCITRAGLPRPVTPHPTGPGAGRHAAPTIRDTPAAGTVLESGWIVGTAGAGLAAILGDQCQLCGWTRNQHRWDCHTGLSTVRRPRFRQLRLPGTD